MTIRQVLRRKLLSFVRSRQEVTEWMEPEFTWAAGMLELAQQKIFEGFEWSSFLSLGGASVFGIRGYRGGFAPGDLHRTQLRAESSLVHPAPVALASSEHYVVAELLSAERVLLSICVHCPPVDWHVLEEHVLVRNAES